MISECSHHLLSVDRAREGGEVSAVAIWRRRAVFYIIAVIRPRCIETMVSVSHFEEGLYVRIAEAHRVRNAP